MHVAGLALGLWLSVAGAQTADQIRMYQNLSPAQKAEVQKALKARGGKVPSSTKAAQAASDAKPAAEAAEPVAEETSLPEERLSSTLEQRYAGRTQAASLAQTPSIRAVDQDLHQFGYDLFEGAPNSFAPATDIPVPADYVIGPGDTIVVQLFGKDNEEYSLPVNRDGRINFPEFGPIPVTGLKFSDLRADLEKRVSEQMIGVKASVSMGELRSIRVFVLGDVTRPGSYNVSSLSTMTNALLAGGGVQPIGSLRNVQLKRNGRLVTRLDLYDLLLRGDTSDDVRLQPGDVIFVPPIGQTAAIAGEVRRPAIYELRGEKTVRQLVEIGGGLLATAVPRLSQLERIDARGNLTLVDLNLDQEAGTRAELADGDVLRIYPTLDRMEGIVLLAGHVRRPGGVAWHENMRLTDLVGSPDALQPQPDLDYVVIRREDKPLAKVSVFSTRLSAAWADPQSEANVLLEPRDQVFVFPRVTVKAADDVKKVSLLGASPANGSVAPKPGACVTDEGKEGKLVAKKAANKDATRNTPATTPEKVCIDDPRRDRQALLKPLLEDLIAQAASGEPTRIVSVGGVVREPGTYPLEPGMHVADLVRAGGGLDEAAYTLGAEITRYSVSGEKREINHISVDLARVMLGDASANIALQAHDELTIKRLPEWADQLVAEVRGEVRFPGKYPIKRGEHLSDLLARAGGLTDQAFAEGSVFTREDLRVKEQDRLDTLARQLESDISASSLEKAQEDAKQAEALSTAKGLLPQLRAARATGRLVIDLPVLLSAGDNGEHDVVLKDGDTLVIPAKTQEVTVIGEVQFPTSHLAQAGLDATDYIKRSGGLTYKADNDRAYVVRANGQVEPANSGWWIFRHSSIDVRPGDTIVVPLDVERMRPLTFWASVTQIVYQLAVTVAAVHSIGAI